MALSLFCVEWDLLPEHDPLADSLTFHHCRGEDVPMAVMFAYRGRACTWRTIKPVIADGLCSFLFSSVGQEAAVCDDVYAGHVGVATKFLVLLVSFVVDVNDMLVPLALSRHRQQKIV